MGFQVNFKRFVARVRLVRAWRGLAVGILIGGIAGLVLSVLDLTGLYLVDWQPIVTIGLASGLTAAVVGLVWPVDPAAVARSIDRRAGLHDRIGTAIERQTSKDAFDGALQEDAKKCSESLKASRIYPVKVGRWQIAAVASIALASTVFLLGNAWPMMSPEAKRAKEELQKISKDIERVAKPIIDRKDSTLDEKALANDLQDFAKRLEKGRIDKESAMQRANELAKQAQKLADKRVDRTMNEVKTAREQMSRSELASKGIDDKALESIKKNLARNETLKNIQSQLGKASKGGDERFSQAALDEMGLSELDPSLLNMDEELRKSIEEYLNERMKEIEKALKDQNLTPDQRTSLKNELKSLKNLQQELKISEEARKILEEFMNSPEYQDIMKQVAKLRSAAKQVSEGKPLSPEQIKALEKAIEELAERLKDSKYRKDVIEAMKKALEQLKAGNLSCEAGGT